MNVMSIVRVFDPVERWWYRQKWLGAIFVVAGLHWLTTVAGHFHWTAELLLTLVFALLGLGLLLGWKSKLYFRQYPKADLAGLWILTVGLVIEVFASLSSFLNTLVPNSYLGPQRIGKDDFINFYFWHFIDALPALKIWDSFAVPPPPYHQQTFLAGLVLIVFRTLVLATLIGAIKDWFSIPKQSPGASEKGTEVVKA
jgi:hypothetical protein